MGFKLRERERERERERDRERERGERVHFTSVTMISLRPYRGYLVKICGNTKGFM